jgi:hypothetical protein
MVGWLSEPEAMMRCLYRVGDDEYFAYALTRRDFLLVSDGRLWAHKSHDWLLAAYSGVLLAHRTGNVYYSPETGSPLYYEATEPVQTDLEASPRSQHPRLVRASTVNPASELNRQVRMTAVGPGPDGRRLRKRLAHAPRVDVSRRDTSDLGEQRIVARASAGVTSKEASTCMRTRS